MDNFAKIIWNSEKKLYEDLSQNGQKPETVIIACCDSRVAPETIFDTGPGELFVIRNVAGIVTPYKEKNNCNSVVAAIEFAVFELGVKHIVVMGHAQCGGINALRQELCNERDALVENDAVGKWISVIEDELKHIKDQNMQMNTEELQQLLEQESVKRSVKRLEEFPYIAKRIAQEKITLHGTWFNIANGELWELNHSNGKFEKI